MKLGGVGFVFVCLVIVSCFTATAMWSRTAIPSLVQRMRVLRLSANHST